MASVGIPVAVFVLVVGAVMGLYFAALRAPQARLRRQLEERIEAVGLGAGGLASDGAAASLVKERAEGPLPFIDRLVSATSRGSGLGRWIGQAGLQTTVSALLLMAAGCAVVVGLVTGMVVRYPWATLGGGFVGFWLPFMVVSRKRAARFRRFEEEFPEALDLVARALKAGHAFANGMKMVSDEMDDPVGPEFRKTFDEQNYGLPVKDALQNLTERVPLLDVRFFATAVMIQRDTGGNLAEILENLAHVVRERFKILRQVRVYTAHGRLTGYVLLALPAVLAVVLSFINPEHMNLLFRESMGQTLLLAAAVMQLVGYVWIKQVVKIEV